MSIKILDCTLRDGGYINNWAFEDKQIINIITSLEQSHIDIIECGYLNDIKGENKDSTLFNSSEVIDNKLDSLGKKTSEYVLMINYGDYNAKNLIYKNESSIDGIRLAFHKKDLNNVVDTAYEIIKKGYRLFFQPMLTDTYSTAEIEELLKISNELNPYILYIVDSFGSMEKENIQELFTLYNQKLKESIAIGFHPHNNLQLAYSNSINFIENASNRNIVVDSSIFGMGRGAGNLNSELIAKYLNDKGANYNLLPILEVIDSQLEAIYREKYWGYSAAYFLSAMIKLHPNYATYLMNKKSLTIGSINTILNKIEKEKYTSFDKEHLELLYDQYNSQKNSTIDTFEIEDGRSVLILASGVSVKNESSILKAFIKDKNPFIIVVNHVNNNIEADLLYFSNEKRVEEFIPQLQRSKKVFFTSNIHTPLANVDIVDFDTLFNYKNIKVNNVAILLLNMLAKNNFKEIFIAGLDGFNINSSDNYVYKEYGRILDKKLLEEENIRIANALDILSEELSLLFVTTSIFDKGVKC